MADKTVPEQLKPHAFQPGQSGNPAGRPKGARSKLGEEFLSALLTDFNKADDDGKINGIEAIRKMRTDNPDQYVRVIASILPKELTGEEGGPIIAEIRRVIIDP